MRKTDFDNKLISFNRKINSNKKIFGSSKKLNSLTTKNYNFFLGRMFFTSNDGSQNTFVYQLALATLELEQRIKVLIMFLVGNQREHVILNLSHYILLSCIA